MKQLIELLVFISVVSSLLGALIYLVGSIAAIILVITVTSGTFRLFDYLERRRDIIDVTPQRREE